MERERSARAFGKSEDTFEKLGSSRATKPRDTEDLPLLDLEGDTLESRIARGEIFDLKRAVSALKSLCLAENEIRVLRTAFRKPLGAFFRLRENFTENWDYFVPYRIARIIGFLIRAVGDKAYAVLLAIGDYLAFLRLDKGADDLHFFVSELS